MNIDRFLPWKRDNQRCIYAIKHMYERIKKQQERIDILERRARHLESRNKSEVKL